MASSSLADDPVHFSHHFATANPGKVDEYYTVERKTKLGEGSYGSVYKCKNKATGAERALKSITLKEVKKAEVDLMNELDHPNIVKLYETFQDAKFLYLVMESCAGGELFDRICDEGGAGFGESQAATYMKQILEAMFYMHERKIAHRDIKPENFLMTDKSKNAEVKVIDFGLAKKYSDPSDPSKEQLMKTQAGTPYYVAPEVLKKCKDGKAAYDHKCDIWSCGVLAYILLCGYPPFYGDDDPEILAMVKAGKFDFPDEEWSNISQDAKNFITSMLVMDPAKRAEAGALLQHPWLQKKAEDHHEVPKEAGSKIAGNLQKFNKERKFKKIIKTVMATLLNEKEIHDLREAFKAMDKDGNGTLTKAEVMESLKGFAGAQQDAMRESLEALDSDGSGSIDYTEFVAAALDKSVTEKRENVWGAFRIFDLDGDGKITKEELMKVAGESESMTREMIEEADTNKDGVIDFDEFFALMRK